MRKRFGNLLVAVFAFLVGVLVCGILVGATFSQTTALISVFGVGVSITAVLHNQLSDERINHDSRRSSDTSSESSLNTPYPTNRPSRDSSGASTEIEFQEDPEWGQYEDWAYEARRALSSKPAEIGTAIYNIQGFSQSRVWAFLIFCMLIGWFGVLLAFADMTSSLVEIPFITTLLDNFSITWVERHTSVAFLLSFCVAMFPLWYLGSKTTTTCPNCGNQFSLRSKGRFYNKVWGKERIPITDEKGNETGHYYKYDGYRVLECDSCGETFDQETKWDDRAMI